MGSFNINGNDMKIALCLSGQPRCLLRGHRELSNALLSKYDVDIFIHAWYDGMNSKPMVGRRGVYPAVTEETIQQVRELYDPKIFVTQPQIIFTPHSGINTHSCKAQSVYSLFYSLDASNKLKSLYEESNNFTYDAVVRSRFDIVFHNYDVNIEELDLTKLHVCRAGGLNHPNTTGLMNDQYAISNSSNMNYYSTVYQHLDQYYEAGFRDFVPENLLTYHMSHSDIGINFTPALQTIFPDRETDFS